MSSAEKFSQNTGLLFDVGTTCRRSRQSRLTDGNAMLSREDFLAPIFLGVTTEGKDLTEIVPVCGQSSQEPFAFFVHGSPLLKTSQRCAFEGLIAFSMILPKAGTMRSGKLYRRKRLARLTVENEFSLWPTPQASDSKRMKFSLLAHKNQMARNQRRGFGTGPAGLNLVGHCQIEFGGVPTASFVEWLMGFPMTWTVIED